MSRLIAIWGSPGSGKTTLAVCLASALSERGSVSLLFCDGLCPVLPVLFPKEGKILSVGRALSAVEITESEILRSANVTAENGNVLFLGFAAGETSRSYPAISENRAGAFIGELAKISDYTLVDCPSDAFSDCRALAALRLAGDVVRVASPDMRSVGFFGSVLPLLAEDTYRISEHLRILNNPDGEINCPVGETAASMKKCDMIFPHFRTLKQAWADGTLLRAASAGKTGKSSRKLAELVCKKGEN